MSEIAKGVFLSYASQDAEAAKRICDALRQAGVEVWFDQSELRGGDAWDQKIRRQIKECALFVPVISANTQARLEGYFRIEWKLAAQRTYAMAEEKAFLLPVVLDGISGTDAMVPAEFREVQWTRIASGDSLGAFCERARTLLDGKGREESSRRSSAQPVAQSGHPAQSGREAVLLRQKRGLALGAAFAVIAVVLGFVAWRWVPRAPVESSTVIAAPSKSAAAQPPLDFASAKSKSIAVLPFENLSDDRDNNAFFADGVHEEILTNLAHIRELRVVSRASVMEYRGKSGNLRAIAERLNVAYVLQGSVRRADGKLRLTAQLIRAATDEHVWAETMTRDLRDIFALQSELAEKVARSLHAALSPQEKALIERPLTDSPEAYDLFLKAGELLHTPNGGRAEPLLQTAVQLDPKFAAAWSRLCTVHARYHYYPNFDRTEARLAKAKAALDVAVRLAPDAPETIRGVGDYYYYGFHDYARAAEQYEKLLSARPNDSAAAFAMAMVRVHEGRWLEGIAYFRKAVRLDPNNLGFAHNLVKYLDGLRRFDEAREEQRRLTRLAPDDMAMAFNLALFPFRAAGSTAEMDAFLAGLDPKTARSWPAVERRKGWALIQGDHAEFDRLEALIPRAMPKPGRREKAIDEAVALAARGDLPAARARLEGLPGQIRARLAEQPLNEQLFSTLAEVEALLGHAAEALAAAQKAVDLVPVSANHVRGPRCLATRAFVNAWLGQKGRAIAEYGRLLRQPFVGVDNPWGLNVHVMRRHPDFAPLRGDPRFEALLDDPKNNKPLF